jgi:hypothetical protein
MRIFLPVTILGLALVEPILANSFEDDSHYVRLGARTGYYIVRDGSKLSNQLGLYDAPYVDSCDPLRHGYGADVLAFRFDKTGRLLTSPAYIANAEVNEFYTRWISSLVRGRSTTPDVEALFGKARASSRRPDGIVLYYTIEVFNPFEPFSHGGR